MVKYNPKPNPPEKAVALSVKMEGIMKVGKRAYIIAVISDIGRGLLKLLSCVSMLAMLWYLFGLK